MNLERLEVVLRKFSLIALIEILAILETLIDERIKEIITN